MTVELAGVFADELVTFAKLLGDNWYVSPVAAQVRFLWRRGRWDLGTWTAGSGFQKIALMDSILGGLVFLVGSKSVYIPAGRRREGGVFAARTQCRRGLSRGLFGDRDPSR